MPDNSTDKQSKIEIKTAIIVSILTLIGGLIGALITFTLQNEVSKREINLETLSFIAKDFLKEKPIILTKNPTKDELDKLIQHKETAFLARELTKHLMENYEYIDFRSLQVALSAIERRYSYAQIYKAAGQSLVVCENLVLLPKNKSFQITSRLAACGPSDLDGIILKLLKIDIRNYRFRIRISNDQKHLICWGGEESCAFWIDLGDRLESTSYRYLFIAEYIGYHDVYNQLEPMVAFSILERVNNVIKYPEPLQSNFDNSYWDYEIESSLLNIQGMSQSNIDECMPFFDSDPSTNAQPRAPSLDRFGKSILRACGAIRGRVSGREFDTLINDHFDGLKEFLPKKWKGLSQPDILSKLKQIWLTHNGFNHVFCGEWEDRTVKGLHYRGRYLQLQSEQSACYTKSPDEEIVDDHIYTIGVGSADGANWHAKKGYALQQSATELFILGISAFERCTHDKREWKPYQSMFEKSFYIKSLSFETEVSYRIICKATIPNDRSTYGILTIYSDATPIEDN